MRPLIAILLSSFMGLWAQAGTERRRVSSPIAFYDDADISAPGMVNISEYFSYTKVPAGRDVSFPCTYFSLGINKRVSVSGGLGYARSLFEGTSVNGLGDTYVGVKVLIAPEGKRRPALALDPMIEILGEPSIADNPLAPDRVNYVLPLVLQKSVRLLPRLLHGRLRHARNHLQLAGVRAEPLEPCDAGRDCHRFPPDT